MKNYFLKSTLSILFILTIFLSCGSNKERVPKGIISMDKMSEILTDVQIAEASFTLKQFKEDEIKYNTSKYYKFILNKNHVSENEFEESFEYYSKHPEQFEKVFKNVMSNLNRKQAELSGHPINK